MAKKCEIWQDRYPSADGLSSVSYCCFVPLEVVPRAVIQISHGMCEYFMRYRPLAEYLCELGYVVCGNDHTGHGESAANADALGFTGGVDAMVEDLYTLTEKMRGQFENLPVILVGHSMGSFLARYYAEIYPDSVDGLVIVGTGGPDNPTELGKALAKTTMKLRGEKHRSPLITEIAFGSYNKGLVCEKGKKAWLTRDAAVVDAYAEDKFCNYTFTAKGYYDLFDMIGRVSRPNWAGTLTKDLPVLILSGEADPVGAYGKGVVKVHERLLAAGMTDVKMILYPEMRHEVFNEIGKEQVYGDLVAWLEEHGF